MAEVETATGVFDRAVRGAVKCQAPGCPNWFVKAGNRHRYCKGPGCTYRRGQRPMPRIVPPSGAAAELMLRLQDELTREVGLDLLGDRRKAVQGALRAADMQAVWGALIDEAGVCVLIADRVSAGKMRFISPPQQPQQRGSAPKAVGLVHAIVSSHRRTFDLAEHRVSLLWAMLSARDELASAEHGVHQMAGSPQEEDAQGVLAEKRAAFERAKRAVEAAESAWRERARVLQELTVAAATLGQRQTPVPV